MREIVTELNDTISSRGAIVLAKDGMLITSDVREGVNAERLSALGAAIVNEIGRSMSDAGLTGFGQIEIAAEHGKVILVEAGPTYLMVLLGARLEIGPGSIEIKSAAKRIARAAELAA